eukprot:4284040-Alexandrium_andersonii.AAC.1
MNNNTQPPGHSVRTQLPHTAKTRARRRAQPETTNTGHNCLLAAICCQNSANKTAKSPDTTNTRHDKQLDNVNMGHWGHCWGASG